MAINTISYTNKSDINVTTTPVQNKISSSDMNEIKSVVNSNATLMGDLSNLNTSNNTSIVDSINSVVPNIVTGGSEVQMPWKIDNKWVYAKRFHFQTIADNSAVSHGLTNFQIVDVHVVEFNNGVTHIPSWNAGTYFTYGITDTAIEIYQNIGITGTMDITLYYIKTS